MGKYRNLAAPEEYISDFEGGFPDFIFDIEDLDVASEDVLKYCLLYTSPSPRDS